MINRVKIISKNPKLLFTIKDITDEEIKEISGLSLGSIFKTRYIENIILKEDTLTDEEKQKWIERLDKVTILRMELIPKEYQTNM